MAKSAYPTGVENHGGTLRIWFIYKGSRVRESLGVLMCIRARSCSTRRSHLVMAVPGIITQWGQ